jgi:peptidoglycan/xylan/chitin deacetylase (PgdA/CDA1 family)
MISTFQKIHSKKGRTSLKIIKKRLALKKLQRYNSSVKINVNFINSIVTNEDSLDWKDYGVDSIIQTVIQHKHLGNGSIILCHNGAKYTAQALDTLITTLQDQGYELVPISQLIYRDNYHLDVEGRQIPAE